MEIRNPIIPGFHPDPSICRVGDDFYIANSSFSFFPGIPIHHSRDLCHWELIGHAFSRVEQLPLTPASISGGLFAPTLRWDGGLFYLIVTNVTIGKTCIVTAEDPAGEWSMPHFIPDRFDPDIFWDADGKCYVTYANNSEPDGFHIFTQELDTETWTLVGEEHPLWKCALYDAHSPEGPHIYRINDWYYLLIAEGGCAHDHAVAIARSKSLFGPYRGNPANPIFTHRHLSAAYPIQNTGHADLVQLRDGSWYMTFLAARPYAPVHDRLDASNLGRETFLVPVSWEEDCPVVSGDTGRCELSYPAPNLPPVVYPPVPAKEAFDTDRLAPHWNTLGTPANDIYRLANGRLYIRATAAPIDPPVSDVFPRRGEFKAPEPFALGFVGRRQEHKCMTAEVTMEFAPAEGETAGLVLLEDGYNSVRIELGRKDGRLYLSALRRDGGSVFVMPGQTPELAVETLLATMPWETTNLRLRITAIYERVSLYVLRDGEWQALAEDVDAKCLQKYKFTGTYAGMFCSGNGTESRNEAAFGEFVYYGD